MLIYERLRKTILAEFENTQCDPAALEQHVAEQEAIVSRKWSIAPEATEDHLIRDYALVQVLEQRFPLIELVSMIRSDCLSPKLINIIDCVDAKTEGPRRHLVEIAVSAVGNIGVRDPSIRSTCEKIFACAAIASTERWRNADAIVWSALCACYRLTFTPGRWSDSRPDFVHWFECLPESEIDYCQHMASKRFKYHNELLMSGSQVFEPAARNSCNFFGNLLDWINDRSLTLPS